MSHGQNPGSFCDEPFSSTGSSGSSLPTILHRMRIQRGVQEQLNSAAPNNICTAPLAAVTCSLFFPLACGMMLSSSIGIVDMYIAGFLGPTAQAAVGLGDQLIFLVIVLGSGLATACSSFVARAIGSGNFKACRLYTRASLLVALTAGLFSALLGMLCARPLLEVLGASSEVAALAVPYTACNSLANAPFVLSLCLSSIFRASGRPLLSVYLWLITALLSNALSLLIFFCGGKNMKSLDALAFGWDIGCLAGCIFGLFLFKRLQSEMSFSESASRQSHLEETGTGTELRDAIKDLILVGAPAVVTELSLVVSHFIMYRLLAFMPDSSTLQAAWTIKLKLEESLALIPLMALGMSTAVIVGQNLGAGADERARQACLKIAVAAALAMFVLGALVSFAAPLLSSCFSSDRSTQEATALLLVPSVLLFPLSALSSILCAGWEGAGRTRGPMILNLVFQVVARTALTAYLALHESMHLAGIALGLGLAQLMMTSATLGYSYLQNRGHGPGVAPGHEGRLDRANGMDRIMTSP